MAGLINAMYDDPERGGGFDRERDVDSADFTPPATPTATRAA